MVSECVYLSMKWRVDYRSLGLAWRKSLNLEDGEVNVGKLMRVVSSSSTTFVVELSVPLEHD